jgi:hypothetical protein
MLCSGRLQIFRDDGQCIKLIVTVLQRNEPLPYHAESQLMTMNNLLLERPTIVAISGQFINFLIPTIEELSREKIEEPKRNDKSRNRRLSFVIS